MNDPPTETLSGDFCTYPLLANACINDLLLLCGKLPVDLDLKHVFIVAYQKSVGGFAVPMKLPSQIGIPFRSADLRVFIFGAVTAPFGVLTVELIDHEVV